MKKIILFFVICFSTPVFGVEIKEVSRSVWLVEDHSLPIIIIKLAFKGAGSAYDPDGKSGVSSMLSAMLNEGAGELDNIEFNEQLEEYAVNLSFAIDKDNFYITLKTLSEHRQKAFELLELAMTNPKFDNSALERVRTQILAAIAMKKQSPQYLADLKWNEVVFGTHPYARSEIGTEKTVSRITRNDLQTFMQKHFSNMVVSAAGDINEKELREFITLLPARQQTGTTNIEYFNNFPKGTTVNIDNPNPQSVTVFGHKGIGYHDPDFYNAYVLNYILGGGGLQSRLMQEVREKKGLAYSVYSYLDPLDNAAIFKGSVGTKGKSMEESINIIKEQITSIKTKGISQSELTAAKNYLIGSFPLKMTSSRKIVNLMTFMQLENLDINFLNKRNQYIQNITIKKINAFAEKFFDPVNLILVTVGKILKIKKN